MFFALAASSLLFSACSSDDAVVSTEGQNEAVQQIVVHPPFWWSLPAKILYLLLIGYAIWLACMVVELPALPACISVPSWARALACKVRVMPSLRCRAA